MHHRRFERNFPTTHSIVAGFSSDRRKKMEAHVEQFQRALAANQRQRRCLRRATDYARARNVAELADWFLCDVHEKCDAKACLLFHTSPELLDQLILESVWHDLDRCDFTAATVSYCWNPEAPETFLELETPIFESPSHLELLFSACHYRMLDVPLIDCQESFRGLVRVVRSLQGDLEFTEKDRRIAELLADKYLTALDRLRRHRGDDDGWLSDILQELDSGLSAATNELSVGKIVLEQAARLVRADRADLVLWDEATKDLVIGAQYGKPVPAGIAPTRPVPTPSIIREVWSKGGHRYLRDVSGEKGYYPADPETRSELVFRFDWNDRAVGVLNVESYRADGFEERDIKWIRLLSQYASSATARAHKDSEQLGLLKHLTERTTPATDVLKLSLQGVKAYWGYDAGLIYYADFAKRQLICVESIGCEHLPKDHDITSFSFTFDQRSLACKVFHEKQPYFSEEPTKDENVSQEGVEYFQIRGPLIGVPLVYEGRGVGVMVVWSRGGKSPYRGTAAHLAPFMQLAAPSIAAKTDRRMHEAMVKAAQDMLSIRQTSDSNEDLLRRAIECIHKAGFDRVRLFKFDATEGAFVGCASEGMATPEQFLQTKIFLAENPYARDTAATAITNPSAREYHYQFGSDPDAQRLEKDVDIAWLVAPLVVHQRLYGQIVVDNARTRRAFERQDFDYVNFLATLLAETLANVESVETMRQRALPVLLRHLHIQDSLEAFIRHFLVFIASGRGLGFSRAIFLQFDQSERRLGPYDGIGSITFEEFHRIALEVVALDLDEQLRRASEVSDEELNLALQDFSFLMSDEQRQLLLACGDGERHRIVAIQTSGSGPLDVLAKEIERCIQGTHFLVAPLRAVNALSGLVIVDRTWQGRRMGEADHAQLEGFLKLAEFLLTDHVRTRRFMECLHEDAFIGKLTRSLPHNLTSRAMRDIDRKVNAARGQLIALDYDSADSTLKSVEDELAKATRSIERLEGLWRPQGELKRVHPRVLFTDVVEIVGGHPAASGVEIRTRLGTRGELKPIPIYHETLWRALYLILINALSALDKSPDSDKSIDIHAEEVDGYLSIEILDTGAGIDDEVLRARRYKVDAYTTDVEKGLGFGLMQVQAVVEGTHGGCFQIMRRTDRPGTLVLIRLPLDGPPTAITSHRAIR